MAIPGDARRRASPLACLPGGLLDHRLQASDGLASELGVVEPLPVLRGEPVVYGGDVLAHHAQVTLLSGRRGPHPIQQSIQLVQRRASLLVALRVPNTLVAGEA